MLNEPDAKPKVCYIAFLREEQKDVIPDFEQLIYSHWDTAAGSPPKARAVEPLPDPDFLGQEMRRDFLPTCWRNLLKERRATITSLR